MKLKLIREEETNDSTLGSLYIDNVFECFTLEDISRDVKIMHETCIPAGTYEVQITFSTRFQKQMPLLLNVLGFRGIRIHSGNTKEDTSGCILVGQVRGQDIIYNSKIAFTNLFEKLVSYPKKIEIEIVNVSK